MAAVAAGYTSGVISAPAGFFFVQPRGAPRSQFDWGNAMLGATAAGTVLLAAFTAALAYTTSGDVSATWALARLTLDDQAARERPILIVTRADFTGTGRIKRTTPDGRLVETIALNFAGQVQNIGLGPAVNIRLRLEYLGPEEDIEFGASSPSPALIPVLAPRDPATGASFVFYRPEENWTEGYVPNMADFRLIATFQDRRLRPAGEAINLDR